MNKYVVVLALFLLTGCDELKTHDELNYENRLFSEGDIVNHKLKGNTGIVLKADCKHKESVVKGGCFYHVRFTGHKLSTITNTYSDDENTENKFLYLVEDIRPFEIELAQSAASIFPLVASKD
jgi:hypothetical protein